jgi:hypothetical protein
MTGTTAMTGPAVGTGGLGMAATGTTTVGMATAGTVGGTSGLRTAMTGTTVAMRIVVGTGGLGMATVGTTTVGMATAGTVGDHLRHKQRIIRHLRPGLRIMRVPRARPGDKNASPPGTSTAHRAQPSK